MDGAKVDKETEGQPWEELGKECTEHVTGGGNEIPDGGGHWYWSVPGSRGQLGEVKLSKHANST